jgi:hypothetical protein
MLRLIQEFLVSGTAVADRFILTLKAWSSGPGFFTDNSDSEQLPARYKNAF